MRTTVDMFSILFAEGGASENWIQIMKTGKFLYQGQDLNITVDDLNKFKENFDSKVRGVDIAVDVSHNPDAGSVGWFKELQVRGDQLWARVSWTDEGAGLIKSGKFRYFSPEFMFQWTDTETRKVYKDVLLGGALTNRPFLKNMQEIQMSEDATPIMWFNDSKSFDPDGDGDNDATSDPKSNPDWMMDVLAGVTAWPSDKAQQDKLLKVGATKEACDAAYKVRQSQIKKMSEDNVTNAHKSPPKGKPQDKSQYADPENYKYPIDADHIHAAVSYYNQGGQQSAGGYSSDEWASIGRKIASAANKLIGPGHSFKDGKIETPTKSMDEDPDGVDPNSLNPNDGEDSSRPVDDENAGKFSDTHTKSKTGGVKMPNENNEQVVSFEEHKALLDKVALLEKNARRVTMSEKVSAFVTAGKVVPAQKDSIVSFMETLTDEQVSAFAEIMDKAPAVVTFGEVGNGSGINPAHAHDKNKDHMDDFEARVKVLMNEGNNMSQATAIAFHEFEEKGITIEI